MNKQCSWLSDGPKASPCSWLNHLVPLLCLGSVVLLHAVGHVEEFLATYASDDPKGFSSVLNVTPMRRSGELF